MHDIESRDQIIGYLSEKLKAAEAECDRLREELNRVSLERDDDAGRVGRVAKYLWAQRYAVSPNVVDAEWTAMQPHNKNEWMVEARALLAVADGMEPC